MDETRKSCVEETQCDRGDFAGAYQGNWIQPGPSTFDYSRGQEFRKVCPPQEVAQDLFLQSGLAANMEDEYASYTMMDRAMPYVRNGTANFSFCFNKNLRIRTSIFEDHVQFAYRRHCGKGATGDVQAFTDTKSSLNFVRKRYRKTDGQKDPFRKEEVKSLVKLSHPGVVKLYALLCSRGTVDLLMEDCGYPLKDCLKKFCEKKISGEKYWKVIEDLGQQGFEALMYIHRKGFGHLDVKPENFLAGMVPNDRNKKSLKLVLADFGSAVSLLEEMTFDMPLTEYYWPPELWLHFEKYIMRLKRGVEDVYRFLPKKSIDTFAMGLVVNYMGSLKHLLKDLEDQQKTERPVIPPENLHHACQNFPGMNPDFVFKLFLMKHHACEIPKLATGGPWLFPNIPPALLQVIQGTLHPDPELRWTDEQAANHLAGKRLTQQVDQNKPDVETLVDLCVPSQPGMSAPIQVQDPDMGGCSLPEQAQPQFIPVREVSQQIPDIVVGASTDTAVLPTDKPKMSEIRKIFSQRFIPLVQPWDRNTASPSQGASQLNEGFRTSVCMRTGVVQVEQNDMDVGSQSQKIEAPTQQPSATLTEKGFEIPTPTANKLWAETKDKAGALIQNGIEHGLAEGSTGEKVMKGLEEKTAGKIMHVTKNLEMLSVQNTVALAQQTTKTEGGRGKGAVCGKGGGKGKAIYGKGGYKRKPVRPGGKREESKEIFDKVKAGSAITKIRSPGKTVSLHNKKVPVVSGQAVPPQVHFLVASSSHPKPKTHTLPLAVPGTAHLEDVVVTVDARSGKLDRPPDVSVGPSYGLEHYSSAQPLGNGSQREDRLVAHGGLPITDGASFAPYAPGQSGVGGLQNLEELYDLLDERGIIPQLPSGPGYADVEPHAVTDMEQTLFVGNANQFGMEDEPMVDIKEGMSLDVELMATVVEMEACGNVPRFDMICDQ